MSNLSTLLQVYLGTLPTCQLIAIKRAQKESMQGGLEFKTEIELLSRVHHKNLVSLVGFCFNQGEQMLVYEYVPNGSLKDNLSGTSTTIKMAFSKFFHTSTVCLPPDTILEENIICHNFDSFFPGNVNYHVDNADNFSLTFNVIAVLYAGKSGFRLDWMRRLKIALGAARGLAYLHELANPPIIHRDIKSTNILLDEHLNAKVSDFGLSKPMGEGEKGHVSTQVKGTMVSGKSFSKTFLVKENKHQELIIIWLHLVMEESDQDFCTKLSHC